METRFEHLKGCLGGIFAFCVMMLLFVYWASGCADSAGAVRITMHLK